MTKEFQPKHLGKLAAAFGSLTLASAAIAACGGNGETKSVKTEPTTPPQPSLTREIPTPAITLEQKIAYSKANLAAIRSLNEKPIIFSPQSKVVNFGCNTDPQMPGCGGIVDTKTWQEYNDVVLNKILPKIRERGLDPCMMILTIAVSDNSLWSSYDATKNPIITECH